MRQPEGEYPSGYPHSSATRYPRTGERLRAWRAGAGLSIGELSKQLGIHPSYVTHMEKGKYLPRTDIFARLSVVFTPMMVLDVMQVLVTELPSVPPPVRPVSKIPPKKRGPKRVREPTMGGPSIFDDPVEETQSET